MDLVVPMRYMFIDNSPKSFVDGSKGKGMIQSVGSDMLSITPDKVLYAATGKSVPGSFEHQKCINVSEFNMDGTLRGFTSKMFNFKAKKSYLQELQDILKRYITGDFSLSIDLIQNVTNDSILFTIYIYKIYDSGDTTFDDLKRFSEEFISSEQTDFLKNLSEKLFQNKVYFMRRFLITNRSYLTILSVKRIVQLNHFLIIKKILNQIML